MCKYCILHHGLDIEDLLRPHWTILLIHSCESRCLPIRCSRVFQPSSPIKVVTLVVDHRLPLLRATKTLAPPLRVNSRRYSGESLCWLSTTHLAIGHQSVTSGNDNTLMVSVNSVNRESGSGRDNWQLTCVSILRAGVLI